MRYKARDNIYNGGKYYKKNVEYKPEELPQGLTEKELGDLFEARGIPDNSYVPAAGMEDIPAGVEEDESEGFGVEGIELRPPEDYEDDPAEHTVLIEYAHEHGVKAAVNWKPATIISRLEEAGVDVSQFEGKF